ncbi:hypothetical protein [uncultured Muribaculum sp.]|uniref:hypothetical protein n=1 Tax=uncultured Muribaculum sp. TaxID=1918613 RepID=UPI00267760FE|nr:hypothetical protein [uncultured Muribaculum sp.]
MENIHEIVIENARRNALINLEYCPVRGIGCTGERVECYSPVSKGTEFIPKTMYDSDKFHMVKENAQAWRRLRICHDFEYWAATCCTIKDKRTGCDVFMRLNRPQRRVLAIMEQQRMAGDPVRLIMLKARQWGGSTLVQVYMAWIQLVHKRSWNSLICAHVKDTAATIRGMYSKILSDYPADVWDEDGVCRPEFRVYERSTNIRYIPGRDCRVTLGSAEKQDSVRGGDFAMAHLSEVAFWGDTTRHSPEGFVRAICGSIMREPFTLIVMESTANGTGNFFHAEWLRACSAEGSDKIPVFVPWYEIELYSKPVGDVEALWSSLDSYERGLWHKYGCTLEQIAWYREKRREYPTRQLMAAEYPTDDVEAFANTGSSVFPAECVAELAKGCMLPLCLSEVLCNSDDMWLRGQLQEIADDGRGTLSVWKLPDSGSENYRNRYVVAVDVGGRSDKSDYSVILVLDSAPCGGVPEVVAQWRGHCDHDILTKRAALMGRWYGEALLVVESNTLESSGSDGETGLSLLAELAENYPNMYHRECYDREYSADLPGIRVGFHTNRATKSLIITNLIAMVREGAYVERDTGMINELSVFEYKVNGSTGAKDGCHDDRLMTRAIALHVARRQCRQLPVMSGLKPRYLRW